jgi:hypothetical protein
MNSVVQTGVKSAGCENITSQLPRKSESFSFPWVVIASNSGAFSPSRGKVPAGASSIFTPPPFSDKNKLIYLFINLLSENRIYKSEISIKIG